MTDHPQLPQVLHGPVEQRLVDGRLTYFAPGVPVLDPDAHMYEVPPCVRPGETGAVAFARDIGGYLSRLFGRPVRRIIHRENRWDHRPCPRAQTDEFTLDSHVILVTAYDTPRSRLTQYAISVDGRPVAFPASGTANLPWQIASAAWRSTRHTF